MNERAKAQIDVAARPITGNFNLGAQLPNGRSIQVVGYLYDGESLESVNERLDMMQEAIERQRARCEIPELEAKRDMLAKQLDDYANHLESIEEKRKQGQTLSSQEKMTLNQKHVTVERIKKEIDKGSTAIEEARRKAAAGR